MRIITYSFITFALFPLLVRAQAPENGLLECDDTNLVPYLTGVIDGLWANGLTRFEELVIKSLESEEAYTIWENLFYTQERVTLLAPTDDAFGKAGYDVASKTPDDAFRTVALYIAEKDQAYNAMPQVPLHAIAATKLKLKLSMTTDAQTEAAQVLVLQQGADGKAVVVRQTTDNSSSWAGPIDMSWTPVGNIVILPIDTMIAPPPPLSQALAAANEGSGGESSGLGLTNLEAALKMTDLATELEKLTEKGFTIFAPIDSSWDARTKTAAEAGLQEMLSNHFAVDYTLYSPAFAGDEAAGQPFEFKTQSGETLLITHDTNSGISTVTLGDVTATLLRTDVTLQNGVLHVIDKVLSPASAGSASNDTSTNRVAPTLSASGSAKPSVSPSGPKNGTGASAEGEGAAFARASARSLPTQIVLGLSPVLAALGLASL